MDLIEYTETSKNIEFRYIRSWPEYRSLHKKLKVTKSRKKLLEATANILFKKYCNEVTRGVGQFSKLLVYNTLTTAAAFYDKDARVLADMLDEYETYLLVGNFTDFLFLKQRPFDKLWDHRSF
jgi:hypothetical protein